MNLIEASQHGDLVRVRELLSAEGGGEDPNFADIVGQTPLWWASVNDHLEVVKELLRVGADPNIVDEDDETPLHWASVSDYPEISKELLSARAEERILIVLI